MLHFQVACIAKFATCSQTPKYEQRELSAWNVDWRTHLEKIGSEIIRPWAGFKVKKHSFLPENTAQGLKLLSDQFHSWPAVKCWGFSFPLCLRVDNEISRFGPWSTQTDFVFPLFSCIFHQKTLGAEVPKLTHRSCSTSRVCKKSWWGRLTFAWWGGLKSLGCFGPCIQSCCPDLMLEMLLSRVYCTSAVSQGSV